MHPLLGLGPPPFRSHRDHHHQHAGLRRVHSSGTRRSNAEPPGMKSTNWCGPRRRSSPGAARSRALARVVEEAGVPMSSVYRYFGSKDGILLAVMERGAGHFFAELPDLTRRPAPAQRLARSCLLRRHAPAPPGLPSAADRLRRAAPRRGRGVGRAIVHRVREHALDSCGNRSRPRRRRSTARSLTSSRSSRSPPRRGLRSMWPTASHARAAAPAARALARLVPAGAC